MKSYHIAILCCITACTATPSYQLPSIESVRVSLASTAGVPSASAPHRTAAEPVAGKSAAETKWSYVRGSTHKVCQVTGDFDRERQEPTINKTESRFGVAGTDLGSSFEHEGKVYFLFGDTNGRSQPKGEDSIAFTTDRVLEGCLNLQFVTDGTGNFSPLTVQGISLGLWEVPTGGFSAHGAMYVFFMTDRPRPDALGRSVLARSDDGGHTFSAVYEASRSKFIEASGRFVTNAELPGLPQSEGTGILIWGAGQYRRSDPYLAFVPIEQVEDRTAWKFFAGIEAGQPRWSSNEAEAASLYNQPCVGEFSVDQNKVTKQWMMLYNCNNPRGINLRIAAQPWGIWSDSQVLFNPRVEDGYCYFIHMTWTQRQCDNVNDSGRENSSGGEYAPSIIPRFGSGDSTQTTLYFLMSTWNPYNVVLMKSVLQSE